MGQDKQAFDNIKFCRKVSAMHGVASRHGEYDVTTSQTLPDACMQNGKQQHRGQQQQQQLLSQYPYQLQKRPIVLSLLPSSGDIKSIAPD